MSDAHDPSTCGCCAPIAAPIVDNPPGAPRLRYRIDTHAGFLARMIDGIPTAGALARLTTRDPGDPSIAVLDAWAVVGDILTFYQERIANEGFLGTATERFSIHELASAIGYQLRPGVAASTYLAFTLDAPLVTPAPPPAPPPPMATPSPTEITLAIGTKVQSVPGPGQLPQTFETIEAITAKVAWNALRAKQTRRQELGVDHAHRVTFRGAAGHVSPCRRVWIETTTANLNPGDWLVVRVGAENRDPSDPISRQCTLGLALVRVASATPDTASGRTRVELRHAGHRPPRFALPALAAGVVSSEPLALDAATVRTRIVERLWSEPDLAAELAVQRWRADALLAQVEALVAAAPAPASIWVQRKNASAFGASAPAYEMLPAALREELGPSRNWDAHPRSVWQNHRGELRTRADVFLDRVIDGLAPGGWVILTAPGARPTAFQIHAVTEASLAEYATSGKATGLHLRHADGRVITPQWKRHAGAIFKTRATTFWLASEALPVGPAPIVEHVGHGADGADHVILDGMVLGLAPGQALGIRGVTIDTHGGSLGDVRSEVAVVSRVEHAAGVTIVHFEEALGAVYDRATFSICANVARATHGETVPNEILGDGDGTKAHQAFTLKRPPLTLVSAPTATGTASTLEIQVGGVTWSERDSLYDAGPADRVYQVRTDDTGTSTIVFGDGVRGARLPTGKSNVVATYRSGMGLAGEVASGALTLLASRPLGLRAVTNPAAADGAADPEAIASARANAPRTVRTLDRIVSLSDYEDFARGFAGIGKARGAAVWDGDGRLVHVTIAAVDGNPVPETSALYQNLVAAIHALGDGIERFAVDSFVPRHFALEAQILAAPDRTAADVLAAATAAVTAAYAFPARELAQPVTEAEVMTLLCGVPGVVAAFVSKLHRTDRASTLEPVIAASDAVWSASLRRVLPAELLTLLPTRLHLSARSS